MSMSDPFMEMMTEPSGKRDLSVGLAENLAISENVAWSLSVVILDMIRIP